MKLSCSCSHTYNFGGCCCGAFNAVHSTATNRSHIIRVLTFFPFPWKNREKEIWNKPMRRKLVYRPFSLHRTFLLMVFCTSLNVCFYIYTWVMIMCGPTIYSDVNRFAGTGRLGENEKRTAHKRKLRKLRQFQVEIPFGVVGMVDYHVTIVYFLSEWVRVETDSNLFPLAFVLCFLLEVHLTSPYTPESNQPLKQIINLY